MSALSTCSCTCTRTFLRLVSGRLAERFKAEGNAAYKEGRWAEARDLYSKAVFHNPQCPAYHGNRSAALLMMQEYGAALEDSVQSIKLDDHFTKVTLSHPGRLGPGPACL